MIEHLTWQALLEEIRYAYEQQYPPRRHAYKGVEKITFYKLSLRSNGEGQYKDQHFTFEPKDWDKVVRLYEELIVEGGDDHLV